MKIDIEIDPGNTLETFEAARRSLARLQPAFNQVGAYMERETKMNFARQSTPAGAPWPDLAPATWARKRTQAILDESGDLKKSIAAEPASADGVRINGGGVEYGIYHHTGTSRMPQREYIGIGPQHEEQIRAIVMRYVAQAMG